MDTYIEFKTASGSVLIEVDPASLPKSAKVSKVSPDSVVPSQVIVKATAQLGDAFDVVKDTAQAFVAKVELMAVKPDSVEVEFGLKVTGEAGVFAIAKAGAEANFRVKLQWTINRSEKKS